jgi:gamma-D-glutamyl-L-lysine dipeptidyl-peptidase
VRCAVAVARVRAEPSAVAEQVTQALKGEPLKVVEVRDGWAQVITTYEYVGWVHVHVIERGIGEVPGPTASDPVAAARAFLGSPYEWGGLTAAGIDCSGLVHIAYRATGRLVPRDAWQQETAGEAVFPGEERFGDLVAYGSTERADHIAFWLGAGKILHSTAQDARGVVEEPESEELVVRRRGMIRL